MNGQPPLSCSEGSVPCGPKAGAVRDLCVRWGLVAFVFLLPLKFGVPFVPGVPPVLPLSAGDWITCSWPGEGAVMAVLALFFLWLVLSVAEGRIVWRKSPLAPPMLVYAGALAVSAFFTVDSYRTHQNLLLLGSYALFYFLLLNSLDGRWARRLLLAWLGATGVAAAVGVHQYFVGFEETRRWVSENLDLSKYPERFSWRLASDRVFSTLVYPNALGGFLAMALPVAAGALIFARDRAAYYVPALLSAGALAASLFALGEEKWIWGGALLSAGYPLATAYVFYLTKSLGAFAALGGALFGALAFRRRKFLWLALALALAAAGAAALFPERAAKIGKAPSAKARLEYWAAAWPMVLAHPYTGSGPGTFGALYSQYMLPGAEETQMAHNNYVQALVETGPAGFVAYTVFWVAAACFSLVRWRRTRDRRKRGWLAGCAAGLTAFALHNALDFGYYIPAVALSGLLLAAGSEVLGGDGERTRVFVLRPGWLRYPAAFALTGVFVWTYLQASASCYGYYLLGSATRCLNEGRAQEAFDFSRSAAALSPRCSPAYYMMGGILRSQGLAQEAAAFLGRAVKLSPKIAAYRHELGLALLERPNSDPLDGIRQLVQAANLFPQGERFSRDLERYAKACGVALGKRSAAEEEKAAREEARSKSSGAD